MNYQRTPVELRSKASLYWPEELLRKEASASIIPKLIETQDKFISLLDVSDAGPEAWKDTLRATIGLSANLFLKHLMVLADVGGEPLKRLAPELKRIFPRLTMNYAWSGKAHQYKFKQIGRSAKLDNHLLYTDGPGLLVSRQLDVRMEDVIMLILHGAASIDLNVPSLVKERCVIGSLIGQKADLERFVKQRYIWVSRITGGATSNSLGQLAQKYVKDLLAGALPQWQFTRKTIPGMSQNRGRTDINFDIVATSPSKRHVAIEVAFQFTTNSVIERKAGQAEARASLLRAAGHHIAYVIDGAGNFEREAALTTICRFSDCTVALTASEISILVDFLRTVG